MTGWPLETDETYVLAGPERADVRAEFAMARAEYAARQERRAAAEKMAVIADVLAEARRHPEVYLPLADEPTEAQISIAVDAAVADVAMRLAVAEGTVVALARQAAILRARAARFWAAFREGEVAVANARVAAETLDSLPVDRDADERFESAVLAVADLAPARFRDRVRRLRDAAHPRPLDERHREAAGARRAWCEHGDDAMAEFGLHLSSADAELAWLRIDGAARHLAAAEGESRTLDQLRADIAADLLTGRADPATAPRISVTVGVPVLTLLGAEQTPATLDGRVPIDPETARRLAAGATSFHRVLTHPVSSVVLDVDRTTYRPPADLARLLALRDGTCTFPGCGRRAAGCDLDHVVAWADGGVTSAANLGHLSRRHHTLKHRSRWSVARAPDGRTTWTSPTGATRTSDPPPF